MTVLPPPVQLTRVVAGLVEELPVEFSVVLADDRWAEVSESLRRLAAPGAVTRLADECGPDESARLATLLLARWARIGTPVLAPAAAIVGPTADGELTVVVDGLEPDWTATWHGPVAEPGPPGHVVRLRPDPSEPVRVSVRVFGRTGSGRTILTADAVIHAGGPDAPG